MPRIHSACHAPHCSAHQSRQIHEQAHKHGHGHAHAQTHTHSHEPKADHAADAKPGACNTGCADHISCGHTRAKNAKPAKANFLTMLNEHAAVRTLQAASGLLMIPMVPLLGYEVVESVMKAVPHTSTLSAASLTV